MKKAIIAAMACALLASCSQTVTGPGPLNTVRHGTAEYTGERARWAKSLSCDGVTRIECDARLWAYGK